MSFSVLGPLCEVMQRASGGRVNAENLDHVAVYMEDQAVRSVNQLVQLYFEKVLLWYARASMREVS